MVEYAKKKNSFIAGSDFKSGQTRFKTIISDFLIGAGIKIESVLSYNHLGNNGLNMNPSQSSHSSVTK